MNDRRLALQRHIRKKRRLQKLRRQRQIRRRLVLFCLCFLAAIGLISYVIANSSHKSTESKDPYASNVRQRENNKPSNMHTDEESLEATAKSIYENNKDLLVLVNKEHAIPSDYYTKLRFLNDGIERVAEVMYSDLKAMLEDAWDLGHHFYLRSGYRSYEYQKELVDTNVEIDVEQQGMGEEEALNEVLEEFMPPGHSEHQTGLAIDITSAYNTNLDISQEDEACIQWLHNNCWKYGFIIRYPDGRQDITGISYEPWHFRYVGREAAKFIYENNLTLEEFYQYIL